MASTNTYKVLDLDRYDRLLECIVRVIKSTGVEGKIHSIHVYIRNEINIHSVYTTDVLLNQNYPSRALKFDIYPGLLEDILITIKEVAGSDVRDKVDYIEVRMRNEPNENPLFPVSILISGICTDIEEKDLSKYKDPVYCDL